MKALLVDDDVEYCEIFLECLKEVSDELDLEVFCEFSHDAGWVLKNWPDYDVYFLDIEMEGLNGIELAEKIRRKSVSGEIFFVSFHENYVFDAFGLKAGGFIRKKELQNDLQKALLSVMKRELKGQAVVKIQMDNGESLRVRPAELLYCQSEEHYVRFLWQDDRMIEHMEQKKIGDCPRKRVRPLFLIVKFLTVNDHDIKIGVKRNYEKTGQKTNTSDRCCCVRLIYHDKSADCTGKRRSAAGGK